MSPDSMTDSMRTHGVSVPQSHSLWLSSGLPIALAGKSSSHIPETDVRTVPGPWPSTALLPGTAWVYQLVPNDWSFQRVKKMHESDEGKLHPREANSHVSSIPTENA